MRDFMYGALTAACAIAALYFLRYRRITRDRLFLYFSLAFVAFALNWAALSLTDPAIEVRHNSYILRLAGFVLIIVGIVDKNRRARSASALRADDDPVR